MVRKKLKYNIKLMTHITKAFEQLYIIPNPLSLLNEECFYFHNDNWIIGTYQNGNNWCSHHSGYQQIMGHTHPLRNSQHTTEVNYYPSAEDILYPIINNNNLINIIMTPIGIYEAKYELNDYTINIDSSFYKSITETFNHIYILTEEMVADLSLDKINSLIGRYLIQYIAETCTNISNFINENILINFPKNYNYSLTFYPLINSGLMGLSKVKKSKVKKSKVKS